MEGEPTPAPSPKASPGESTTASPAANAGQGTALALQDQEVRKEVQTPDVPAAFQVPSAKTLLHASAEAEQEVDDHALEMKKAFEKRAAMKKPACAPKAAPKAKAKASVKSAAKAKPTAGGKAVANQGSFRRPNMTKGARHATIDGQDRC